MIKKVLNKGFFIFNITILANFIVLYYQINYPYSIIAKTSGNGIDLYLDLCSGLFTYGGTHVLNIFTCFLVVYNFSYSSKLRNPCRKRLLIIWNLGIIGLSLFISMFNDNKAMFILVPLITIIYFFTSKKSQSARVQRIFCSLLVTLILVPILYNGSLSFKEFIDDNVLNLFDLVDTSISAGNSANGSGERIAMIKYALSNNSTFIFGTGLATTGFYTEYYLGFHHFGQADLGTLLNLGGIYFVTTMVICYFRLIIGIVDKKNRNPLVNIGLFCFFMFVLTYTQTCTSKDLCLALILVALAFRFKFQNDYKVNKC